MMLDYCRGIAGGIFICLTFATVFFVIGFATEGWTIDKPYHIGLWRSCRCGDSYSEGRSPRLYIMKTLFSESKNS